LSIFRSLNNIYAQVIDDDAGKTLVSASSLDAEVKTAGKKNKKDIAKAVGQTVADRAKTAGISTVVFDRGGFQYHGRVQVLADAARERGLKF
jgi:large subunit ribosomal protein L18